MERGRKVRLRILFGVRGAVDHSVLDEEEVVVDLNCSFTGSLSDWALLGLMALSAALALTFVAKCAKAWIDGEEEFRGSMNHGKRRQ